MDTGRAKGRVRNGARRDGCRRQDSNLFVSETETHRLKVCHDLVDLVR